MSTAPTRRGFVQGAAALAAGATLPVIGGRADAATTWEDFLKNSLTNQSTFDANWIRGRYPWGDDSHNGGAKMRSQNTILYPNSNPDSAFVSQRAQYDANLSGNSVPPFNRPLNYWSGVMYCRRQLVINDTYPQYDVKGQFRAPGNRGTWPAFWLSARDPWPPETDIVEFKGDGRNFFNTFNPTSTPNVPEVFSNPISVGDSAANWHEYSVYITKTSGTDVKLDYYLDGQWKAQHVGRRWVGRPLWLIVNLQMEGDSGTPGPTGDTYFEARRIYVGRQRVS